MKAQEFPEFASFAAGDDRRGADYRRLLDPPTVASLELQSRAFTRCKVKMRMILQVGDAMARRIRGAPRVQMACRGAPRCSSTALSRAPPRAGAPPASGARSGDGRTRRYVRSSEPRLKWTDELHQCFMRATAKLGGPEKATPKAILQEMNFRGLKIAHVKSHLQMYRNPRSGKSFGPHSDYSFWRVAQPAEESTEGWNSHAMDKDYQVSQEVSASQMQAAGSRQNVESDSVDASWRSLTRGASTTQQPSMTNVEISTAREHYSSGDHLSVCSLESPAHFNPGGQSSNVLSLTSDHGDESRVGGDFFKMAEVLMGQSRATKSRGFESPDDVDERRQFLSDRILAGDADATRLYDSAEALAHNLLMAMRERKLLEAAGSRTPHETRHPTVTPEVPLELTMAVGFPESDPDMRSEILTLDLTQQLNRPHL